MILPWKSLDGKIIFSSISTCDFTLNPLFLKLNPQPRFRPRLHTALLLRWVMVGNEVKRANDDDHGEFEGTTGCGQRGGRASRRGRLDGQSENWGQFWSKEPRGNGSIDVNSTQVLSPAKTCTRIRNLTYIPRSVTRSALANRNTGAITGAECLETRPESRDPYRVMGGRLPTTVDHATNSQPKGSPLCRMIVPD